MNGAVTITRNIAKRKSLVHDMTKMTPLNSSSREYRRYENIQKKIPGDIPIEKPVKR